MIFFKKYFVFCSIVNVPVSDLMSTPAIRHCCPINYLHDKLQLTQVGSC